MSDLTMVRTKRQVNHSMIEHLEHMLEETKRGEIDGICYVVHLRDGSFESGGSGKNNAAGMAAVMIKSALRIIGM